MDVREALSKAFLPGDDTDAVKEAVIAALRDADITIWEVAEEGDYDWPQTVAYRQSRESAQKVAERQFAKSEEAEETDYEYGYHERQVMQQLGMPSVPVPRFDVSRLRWVARWSSHPDGDQKLQVWRNFGPYGPGWHTTHYQVHRINVKSDAEEEALERS